MLTRRKLLISTAAAGVSAPLIVLILRQPANAAQPIATPQQTAGPFYPDEFPTDHDADLVHFLGREGEARGDVVDVRGKILDSAGMPIAGATVDLWQCDANGIYHHPGDREEGRDEIFQGFGRTETDGEGNYAFRTIRPVSYTGRTPHIHLRVWQDDNAVLTTQFYDADRVTENMADGLYRAMNEAERALVTVQFSENGSEPGVLTAQLDVRLA